MVSPMFQRAPGAGGQRIQVRLAAAFNALDFPLAAQLSLNEPLSILGSNHNMIHY